jgi:hypothetical protein
MAQVRLKRPGVGTPVRQRVDCGVAQHVRMDLEGHLGLDPGNARPSSAALTLRMARPAR